MIDSVLKGTGNSRFLKSAVPAGTSWADALAMLQAGTFPIDFNGINTEGFQQVGTPLNKANLLKDATAAQIGLPPSTTPDGMFQALGNTGELHVWKKTVKTSSDTPAGYTLGDTLTHGNSFIVRQTTGTGYVDAVIREASSISVNDNGVISASWGGTISLRYGNPVTFTPGRFVKISGINTRALSSFAVDDVVWVPSDGGIQMDFSNDYGYYIEFTKCQKVNAHGIIPAGTTTTYPVSTNPNAYQEGSDAKPAGYVLGDVVTGQFAMSIGSDSRYFKYASSIVVSDDGIVSLNNPSDGTYVNFSNVNQYAKGKFIMLTTKTNNMYMQDLIGEVIYWIPNDITVTTSEKGVDGIWINKYQPVTGYAAIPAGTTIEYLGKLGDKARVQVVSYVGTGTYGSKHPTTVAFDIVPKIVFIAENVNYQPKIMTIVPSTLGAFGAYLSGGSVYGLISPDVTITGKRISFFSSTSSGYQMNDTGKEYFAIAIG